MVSNFIRFNNRNINNKIESKLNEYPKNIPCKIDSVNSDMTVNLVSLIDNSNYFNINIFTPLGVSYDLNRLKYGILYYCNYDFSSILNEGELSYILESNQTQFGIFIPIIDSNNLDNYNSFNKNKGISLFNEGASNYISIEENDIIFNNKDKASITMEDGAINISNSSDANYVKMTDSQLSIGSSNPIEIKTETASLYEVINDILEMLTKMNADTVAGNGAPLASPTLTSELPGIITKLQGVLK